MDLGVIMFASDRDVRILAESEILVGDATFKCAPRGLSLVYTLHGKVICVILFLTIFFAFANTC